jgi:hypothetical protein
MKRVALGFSFLTSGSVTSLGLLGFSLRSIEFMSPTEPLPIDRNKILQANHPCREQLILLTYTS